MRAAIRVDLELPAGIDGVLTVDLPPEEAGEFTAAMRNAAIDTIFLLSPTSDGERMDKVSQSASAVGLSPSRP